MNYRHEIKHEINYSDLIALRMRLLPIINVDKHAIDGKYEIRSLYFDNIADKALREKLDGVNMREKFRIRYYNQDYSYILLEKKSKINGLCQKSSCQISLEESQKIVNNDILFLRDADRPLLNELYHKMITQGIKPMTIVDYTREPFVFAPGNVRITIDYNIRTGLRCTDFLNPDAITIPAGESPIILEVKWDEFLPDIIKQAVAIPNRRAGAFSKYAQCRIYG